MIKCKEEEDYEMIEEKKIESKLIKPFDFKSIYIYICCITFALMKCNHCKKE